MNNFKSRDLAPERSRCNDYDCPQWESGCARAEHQLGIGRFLWLRPRRANKATSCVKRIDPVMMSETAGN
ncbi:MAG: hypothetical protein JEY79_11000 [Pseudodesulfovibrio sp.]|nr:hypothetical protein [Pseudodesulfovibrio sp.]